MTVVAEPSALEEARHALLTNTPVYGAECLKIVNKAGHVVPLAAKAAQLKLDRTLEAQRLAGRPMRAIILKARQWGGSTWTQAKMFQRTTLLPNRRARTVAHDKTTAGNLFGMCTTFYTYLPDDDELELKPPIANMRREGMYYFANPSRHERDRGNIGLNSMIITDTAQEVEAGRGFTIHDLHCSECAFYPDLRRKLTGLMNAVPDEPMTSIVLESTANGMNYFKVLWDMAERGDSDFAPVFVAWFEEPGYTKAFLSETERQEFEESIGTGPYGADELPLREMGVSLEQLNWRRWAIANKCQGDIEVFHQEYPSTPEEAFLSTGKRVFAVHLVKRVIQAAEDPVAIGEFAAAFRQVRKIRAGEVHVPMATKFAPSEGRKDDFWSVWEWPVKADPGSQIAAGQYIVSVDPMSGEEDEDGQLAFHGIEVIDHRTRRQVAEYFSRVDPDLVAEQAYLACLLYNRAWFVCERTGGWGLSIIKKVWQDFRYPFVYQKLAIDRRNESMEDRIGWSTDRATKPLLEDGMREMLRQDTHGIRSRRLGKQALGYVRDRRGRTRPEPGEFSDNLMAYMIAQQVAQEKPVKPERQQSRVTSTATRKHRNPITGY